MSQLDVGSRLVHATRDEVRDWDERFYLHPFQSADEYQHVAVERAEGPYLYLADGTRVLDFLSQYCCVNLGHGQPRIQAAIV